MALHRTAHRVLTVCLSSGGKPTVVLVKRVLHKQAGNRERLETHESGTWAHLGQRGQSDKFVVSREGRDCDYQVRGLKHGNRLWVAQSIRKSQRRNWGIRAMRFMFGLVIGVIAFTPLKMFGGSGPLLTQLPPPQATGYKLAFADDFDSLDLSSNGSGTHTHGMSRFGGIGTFPTVR
jgi:hypothetical protein